MSVKRNFFILFLYLFVFFLSPPLFAEEKKTAEGAPLYFRLEPDLVTNLRNTTSFLQIRVEIVGKTSEDIERIKFHQPLLRDRLITLFSTKTKAQMQSVEERKKIREEALQAVQGALTEAEGKPLAEEILFTQVAID